MSRQLVGDRGKGKDTPESDSLVHAPLTNSAVLSHLKACQALTSDLSRQVFREYIKALDDGLTKEIGLAKSNQASLEMRDVQNQLRQDQAELERYFCGYISEGFVKFKKHELHTSLGAESTDEESLSLVGHDQLEETIAISSITQQADEFFAEPLWALNQRFSVLNNGRRVMDANNPAAPIQICDSLRKAFKLVPMQARVRDLAYTIFADFLMKLTRGVVEELNRYLEQQKILPNLKFNIPALARNEENNASRALQQIEEAQVYEGGADRRKNTQEYQSSMIQAIRDLQRQIQSSRLPPATESQGVFVSGDQLVGVLQHMQSLATRNEGLPASTAEGTIIPFNIGRAAQELKAHLEISHDGVTQTGEMSTIDLVGMVFHYMLKDQNIPDNVKALLSYLHTPFLKIAFIDPGFFEQAEHPARVLLNNLAEAGIRWVGNDGSSQYDIYNKIRGVVNHILTKFENDIKVITELLLEFKAYTKNIVRRQDLMEKRATERAQGEEKLREVKLKVNNEIRLRTANKELPSAVLLFLLQPWSDYLSFALLRYGENSDKWNKALALVDNILWCIEPRTGADDRSRQMELQTETLKIISAGFETIGYDQDKGQELIEALSSLTKLALQSKKGEPAPAPMRDKLERVAAQKAGGDEDGEDSLNLSAEEVKMVESLKKIEFGTWFEFEEGRRLKVAWYNARTSHYMLVDQMGKRVDMMSGLAMARKMMAGQAKIISGSSKPFFERALENVLEKLNEKAESIPPGEGDEPH